MTEESQYLSFRGTRIHFCVHMPAQAPRARVLLLASPLINTFHWRKLIPDLVQLDCLTVTVDLPGFGKSACGRDVPQDGAMRANILWGLLDEIDALTDMPNSLWHLAAHGIACTAILEMAALYPDSVRSQIHIAPLFRLPEDKEMTPARRYEEDIRNPERFHSAIERLAGYPMDDYIVDRMRKPLLRPGARESFIAMLREGRTAPAYDMGFCPAMVLSGGRDPLLTEQASLELKQKLSGAELHLLKSAGHFPMETHSRALRDYLRGWIRFNS